MDKNQCCGVAQDRVVAGEMVAFEPFEDRHIAVKARQQRFQYRFEQRFWSLARTLSKVRMVKSLTSSSFFGSVTTVNDTDCELLAVGARCAASRIRPSFSGGTGLDVIARFDRRALHNSRTCSGVGSCP